jgi:hypothetical protein
MPVSKPSIFFLEKSHVVEEINMDDAWVTSVIFKG